MTSDSRSPFVGTFLDAPVFVAAFTITVNYITTVEVKGSQSSLNGLPGHAVKTLDITLIKRCRVVDDPGR